MIYQKRGEENEWRQTYKLFSNEAQAFRVRVKCLLNFFSFPDFEKKAKIEAHFGWVQPRLVPPRRDDRYVYEFVCNQLGV